MLHLTHHPAVLLAWIEPPPFRDIDVRTEDEPDLRLLVLADRGTTLLVEVAEGIPCPRGTSLWVEERGSFEVTGLLSRPGPGGSRTYMRLEAAPFPAAA
jgi:hypothetical protein